jgi:hypothetical protein
MTWPPKHHAQTSSAEAGALGVQEYNTRKRAEHFLKATLLGSPTVSVTSPQKYAKRFRNFLADLFVARYNTAS